MKTKFLILFTALFCSAAFAKAQLVEHQIGLPNNDEITNCEIYDNTNAAGAALVHVGYDNTGNALITKTTPDGGTIIWQKAIPGGAANPNMFYQVIIAAYTPASYYPTFSNGDYIVVGQSGGTPFVGNQAIICRYSNTGTLLASELVTDPGWGMMFTGVCELQNGNIAAVGYENQPGTQNAIIHVFDPALTAIPVWSQKLSNPNGWSPKSIFLSVICDATTIYVVGNTDNAPHTGYDGTVTRFTYAGGIMNAEMYDVTYSYPNYTLNSLWLLRPQLMANNHLAIWSSLSNWIIVGDDVGILDVDNVTFVPHYTSINAPGNMYTNNQGITDFNAVGLNDFVFTIAPGANQFDISAPNNPASAPVIVRFTGGAVSYAHQINDPTNDYALFASYADAANVFAGGFTAQPSGGQKDIFTLEAAGGLFTGNCPIQDIKLQVKNRVATWNYLNWITNPTAFNFQQLQDYYPQMPDQLICQGQGPCTAPCPSMLTLTVVDHDGLPYGSTPCTFDGTVVVSDSNSCWQAYSYQWSLFGGIYTNYSPYFTNTELAMPLAIGYGATIQVIVTFVDAVGDTCRDTLYHDVWCNGGHAGGKLIKGNSTIKSATNADISVYPNPTTGVVNVATANGVLEHIELIDVNGRTVANYNYDNDQKAQISLEKLPPGSYLIRVNGNTTKVVNKIE